jgi:hypothetical protein
VRPVPILSDDWCGLWLKEAAALTPEPGNTLSIEIALSRADGPNRTFTWHLVDGLPVSVTGADPTADMHFEMPEDVYPALNGDNEEMRRAILNGRMRWTGDADKMDALLAIGRSEQFEQLRVRVHAQTKY